MPLPTTNLATSATFLSPCNHPPLHPFRSRLFQCFRTCVQSRPGRCDVINKDNALGNGTESTEGAFECRESFSARTMGLESRRTDAAEARAHVNTALLRNDSGKNFRLIESTPEAPRPVKRNRNKDRSIIMKKV